MTDTPTVVSPADFPTFPDVVPADADARARIAGAAEAMTIPFGLIDMGADNVRDAADTNIPDLAESIRRLGLVQAIGLEPSPNEGRWLVNDGHRRILALAALGLNDDDPVPVLPLTSTEGSPVTRVLRMLAGNLHREDLTPIDEARVVARLHGLYEMTHEQIAEAMGGWNRKTVAQRLSLLELPADAQAAVAAGEWGVEGAQEVARLVRDGAPAQTTNALISARVNFDAAQMVWRKWRVTKAMASMAEVLESRGFTVVTALTHCPTRSGYEAQGRDRLDISKPGDAKGLAPDKVKTLKDPSTKRPVLFVQRGWDNEVAVWTVRQSKTHTPSWASGEPAEWQVDRFAQETMVDVRYRRAEALAADDAGLSSVEALRLAASMILGPLRRPKAERLAGLVGMPLTIDDDDRLNWPATIEAWLDQAANMAGFKRLFWATALLDAAYTLGDHDGDPIVDDDGQPIDPPTYLPHVAHAMAAGIGSPLPPDQWAAARDKARAKMAERTD